MTSSSDGFSTTQYSISFTTSSPFIRQNLTALENGASVNYTDLLQDQHATNFLQQACILDCDDPSIRSVTIQNAKSWKSDGCLKGFYCPWMDPQYNVSRIFPLDQLLPQYCPPTPICALARFGGQTCKTSMGAFEPMVCPAGSYCPLGGTQNITCLKSHYCPEGSFEPKVCSAGASCPEGSIRNRDVIPIALLVVLDFILSSIVIYLKIQQRIKARRVAHAAKGSLKKGGVSTPLNADTEHHGQEMDQLVVDNSRLLYPNPYRSPGFEELAAFESTFSVNEFHNTPPPEESTDLHLFVQSLSKCIGGNRFGLSFDFENLTFQPPKATKPILSQVCGCINAGSLWGVMGASGAGKSTFMNVLMGKTDHTGGITKVNGVPGDIKKYKKIIGYVPQDDIVLPELTVRENILHSARIRLPSNWSDKEIQHHVDTLISCLQLSHVQNSLVGSPGAPVISGGQRKRVSIGMELAAAPMALFLDEPTSGLDATAASSIMSILKALTRLGMTIVAIIHQPRHEIFESLDSLVLLGAGRMIYQGPQVGMQPHFETLGFSFPEHDNPADIMGDIIAGEGRLYKKTGDASIFPLIDHWLEKQLATRQNRQLLPPPMNEIHALSATIKCRGASFHKQVHYCLVRSLVQQYRLKSAFSFELLVSAVAGFLIGLAQQGKQGKNFHGIYHEPYAMLSSANDYITVPQMALLVAISIGLVASAPGVKVFGEEKMVYWREAAAGHNCFAYYLGKVLSTVPRILLACFHFTTLFLLLATPIMSWGHSFLANLLYFWCIYGVASCVSMVARREDGPLLAVMFSLIIGVMSGAAPPLRKARTWHLVWLWRTSPGTWLAEAYFNENVRPLGYLYQIDMAKSVSGFRFDRYALDMCLLVLIGLAYRIVAFLGLRFLFPAKQR